MLTTTRDPSASSATATESAARASLVPPGGMFSIASLRPRPIALGPVGSLLPVELLLGKTGALQAAARRLAARRKVTA